MDNKQDSQPPTIPPFAASNGSAAIRWAQEIMWTESPGTTMRVEAGWFATEDEARKEAKALARSHGWTLPRWWQWWRWRDTRLPPKSPNDLREPPPAAPMDKSPATT